MHHQVRRANFDGPQHTIGDSAGNARARHRHPLPHRVNVTRATVCLIASSFVVCCLLTTAAGADELLGARERVGATKLGEPRLLDERATWFARLVATQTPPAGSPTEARGTDAGDAPTDPPVARQPDLLPDPPSDPLLPTDPLLPPDPLPIDDTARQLSRDETTFTLFRRGRSRAGFARRRRPIAVLGDSLIDIGQMDVDFAALDYATWPPTATPASATSDIPLLATATRTKVAENSSVLPMDRWILAYQHFQTGPRTTVINPLAGDTRRVLNVDRLTIGLEKTLFDGQWSLDVRLPVLSRFDVAASDFGVTNGRLGNASLLVKHLVYDSEVMSMSLGVGLDAPTGSDGHVQLANSQAVIFNDAYHALPFVGLLLEPTEDVVLQAFAQLDIPLNGNRIEAIMPSGGSELGSFDEQELLFLSLSAAHWHFRDPDAAHLRGLAALLELHYTTSLGTSDQVTVAAAGDTYAFGNPDHIDILNMSAGMQAQVGLTDVRAAAVLPLLGGGNKPFKAEFLVQFNRRF